MLAQSNIDDGLCAFLGSFAEVALGRMGSECMNVLKVLTPL